MSERAKYRPRPTLERVKIFFKDWGDGQPIVFHHGWPLSCDDWNTAASH